MLNLTLIQNLGVKILIWFTKFLNFIDIEVKWFLFTVFTLSLSLTFWSLKDKSLDDFMKMTRRKPVLSLTQTIPDSILNRSNSLNVISEETVKTQPSEKVLKVKPLYLRARSYIVYDLIKDSKLDAKNELETLPPASLVKILSVMYFSRDLNFSDRYNMTSECTSVNGQKVGFKIGESISVKDLIYSSLIFSGADAICLLSRTNSNLDLVGFNEYARSLGLKNSNFTNYIGLDFSENYTTSEDMLILTKAFLKKDIFSEIVRQKSFQLEDKKVIYNTNKMLFSEKNSAGVKTGTTDGANENLIYRYKDDEKMVDVLVVILNSSDRYADVREVLSKLYFN